MLVAQITRQLQTLAAVSPHVFQKVQSQLASTAQNLNSNDPSVLLATPAPQTLAPTGPSLHPGQPVQHSVINQNSQQQLLHPQQQPQLSIQSMVQALSSQRQNPPHIQSQINTSSTNPYMRLLSNSVSAAPVINNPPQQSAATNSNILNQAIANLLKADVNGLLINALQKGGVRMPNSATCAHPGKDENVQHNADTKTSLSEGESITSTKTTSRTTSSLTDQNDEGNGTKKRTKGHSNGVAFEQFDSANISSEGTSSNSLSDDANWSGDNIPLKKRMRISSSKNYVSTPGHSSNK
jgi:hypothetical protein